MPEATRVSVEVGGTEISFETGKLAKQASGSVVVSAGDTRVLSTATAGNLRDVDFLPLTVDVEERMYAAGKIPGSFFKREGRAGEKGTLVARMIDRPLRPLFPKGWRRETQLVNMPLSVDHDAPYDILAMNGASAALMVSDVPFPQPVGAVRIGKIEGNFVINPGEEAMQRGRDGPRRLRHRRGDPDGRVRRQRGARGRDPRRARHRARRDQAARRRPARAAREGRQAQGRGRGPAGRRGPVPPDPGVPRRQARRGHLGRGQARPPGRDQGRRDGGPRGLRRRPGGARARSEYLGKAQLAFDKLEKSIIRQRIAVQKKRPDGRGTDEIRDIWIEAGVLPRAHGSAIFTRGQTQALSVASLGTTREEMRVDGLGLETSKRYWHHYNFPPFSVGEAGFMRGPKRRDIGHGALAERALVPMIPSAEEFPYTIRVVSDILESNGSSSMASVCGSSLSLMDAGVPIKRPVAGIAMGLIKEGDDYVVLSDIAGVEDHLGDMDFKVAGTERGITALQMDIKITGVTFDILRDALSQAKEGRTHILGKMAEVIEGPRSELSQFAPRISTIKIDPDKIGLLIGKGGETIRGLCDEFDAQIDVDDDGNVLVYAQTGQQGDALIDRIRSMTKEVEVGDSFQGKVVKTTTFGAFVELAKGTDGLLHISNVSPGQRVDTVEDVLNKGDEIAVRVVEVDRERGRIGLRLAEDPEIAGKSVEELAGVGSGGGGGGGGDRGGRGRDRDRNGRGGDRGGRGRDRDRGPRPPRGDRDPDRS